MPKRGKTDTDVQAATAECRVDYTCTVCQCTMIYAGLMDEGRCGECAPYAPKDAKIEWRRDRLAKADFFILEWERTADIPDSPPWAAFPHVFRVIYPTGAIAFETAIATMSTNG